MLIAVSFQQGIISADGQDHEPEQHYQITQTVTFSAQDFLFDTYRGYDTLQYPDGGSLDVPGKPMVPLRFLRVAIPADMKATAIDIIDIQEEVLPGEYFLFPAQHPLKMSSSAEDSGFIGPDIEVYLSAQPYPQQRIELVGHSDLAGQVMADVVIYPIQYIPTEGTLILLSSITFSVQGSEGYSCEHFLSSALSEANQMMYLQMVQDMVINPSQVSLRTSPEPPSKNVPPGSYEYVIITQASWVSAFQPLADWKTKKGVPATIVTTSWIYNSGGYSGTNLEKIRAFVIDAYNNWGTVYFLLGGDTDVIPCHYRTFSSVDPDPVPNDTYYADFTTNYVCNVHVGRASVTGPGSGAGQIGNFINKILNYEKNPPMTNFAKNAGFYGFDLDASTPAEQCKIAIRNTYVPADWTMTTVYDTHSGNHKTNVIAAMNAGQNLMNHADHSGINFMGTGYTNHGLGLTNADMAALTNANKQSILYSMGCLPAAFDSPVCIAEQFVRNSNGGGVAFVGNTRYGWYNPGNFNTLSMKYDRYFFKSLFPENNYKLGACFSDHKNDAYQYDWYGTYKYIFTELTLLGDPEMPIWKENPISMTATFSNEIPLEPTSFTVTVNSGGSPVNQAYICLWKGTDIYLTGLTNSAGQKTFSLSPTTPGLMHVTVTKQNHLPFEGTTMVIGGDNSAPLTPGKPSGPSNGFIDVEYTFTASTTDPDNDQLWYQWAFGSYTTEWLGPYPSGAVVQAKHTFTAAGVYSVKVKAKDIYDYESAWSSSLQVTITDKKPVVDIGSVTGELVGVSTMLQNSGDAIASNVVWSISLDGGFLLSGESASGTIASLGVGESIRIQNSPVLGFGQVLITITASADGVPLVTKTATGFVFFVYVFII